MAAPLVLMPAVPDVIPSQWHLAHTSWFFETFVLSEHDAAYRSPDQRYAFLSAGLAMVQQMGWEAPLSWEREADGWTEFTLAGSAPLQPVT